MAQSAARQVADGIQLILEYEPDAEIGAEHELILIGSRESRAKISREDLNKMESWGWFWSEKYEEWARDVCL